MRFSDPYIRVQIKRKISSISAYLMALAPVPLLNTVGISVLAQDFSGSTNPCPFRFGVSGQENESIFAGSALTMRISANAGELAKIVATLRFQGFSCEATNRLE
jgi:hypothetical protein